MTCPICGGRLEPDRLLAHAERRHSLRLPADAGWDCWDCLRGWIEHVHVIGTEKCREHGYRQHGQVFCSRVG